jgi:hypothetical protein
MLIFEPSEDNDRELISAFCSSSTTGTGNFINMIRNTLYGQ